MSFEKIIEQKVKRLWSKQCTNYSEATWRADEITRLNKILEDERNKRV